MKPRQNLTHILSILFIFIYMTSRGFALNWIKRWLKKWHRATLWFVYLWWILCCFLVPFKGLSRAKRMPSFVKRFFIIEIWINLVGFTPGGLREFWGKLFGLITCGVALLNKPSALCSIIYNLKFPLLHPFSRIKRILSLNYPNLFMVLNFNLSLLSLDNYLRRLSLSKMLENIERFHILVH